MGSSGQGLDYRARKACNRWPNDAPSHPLHIERTMPDDLVQRTLLNISYFGLTKVFVFLLQVASNVILSQILSPSDFGVIGFAGVFIGFLTQFSDFGLQSAALQSTLFDEKLRTTTFTLKAGIGIVLLVLGVIAAPLTQFFFDTPSIVNVVRLLSLNFVINSFSFLPTTLLTKELNYKAISYTNSVSSLANCLLSIVLACYGYSYWSIVIANLLSALLALSIFLKIRPYRFRLGLDVSIARSLYAYGSKLFIYGFTVFVIYNFDNFIIGSIAGSIALGYYALAFKWAAFPATILSETALAVLFPTYLKFAPDIQQLRNAYLNTLQYVSFIGILGNLLLFCGADYFLFQVLGRGSDKWLPALTTLKILCFYGIVRVLLEPVANVVLSMGKPGLLVKAVTAVAIVEVPLTYVAIQKFDLEGVAIVVTLSYIAQYPIYLRFLKKELDISLGDLAHTVKPSIVSGFCIIMLHIILSLLCIPLNSTASLLYLILVSIVYFIVYGMMTGWKIYQDIKIIVGYSRSRKNFEFL
jgi:lipopolysaccharide exporter